MKIYFHISGNGLADGLVFLDDDTKCVKMGDYICVGDLSDAPPKIVTAEATNNEEEVVLVENAMVTDDRGVISQIIVSPVKQKKGTTNVVGNELDEDEFAVSQICNPSQASSTQHMLATSKNVPAQAMSTPAQAMSALAQAGARSVPTSSGVAPTSQTVARPAPTAGTVGMASRFKPPRKTTPNAQVGTSGGNKRRKTAPTSSLPSYK
ncbi:hypothetical protein D1007_38692 [Hordeum vulgare]|nr:hypothetical protein D1007_38692 [Hordeum vulgare]